MPRSICFSPPTPALTGRRRAKRDGNATAPLLGAPVECAVGREPLAYRDLVGEKRQEVEDQARPLLFRQKPQCRAHASRTSLQLRLGVSKRLVEAYGIRGSAESKLNYVVPRQEACLEFAHLFLDQMTSVISKPNLRSRRRGRDFELVVLCFGSSRCALRRRAAAWREIMPSG